MIIRCYTYSLSFSRSIFNAVQATLSVHDEEAPEGSESYRTHINTYIAS